MTEYTLTTPSGKTLATVHGYPEAVLAARALAHVEPVAVTGGGSTGEFRTTAEWDEHVEKLRALFAPA